MTTTDTSTLSSKKRILFVDDELPILDLFSMMFRKVATEWDISLSRSGAEALALMDQHPFEVVVSDMRMPGMNGAQFLSEVMQRHPSPPSIRRLFRAALDKILRDKSHPQHRTVKAEAAKYAREAR